MRTSNVGILLSVILSALIVLISTSVLAIDLGPDQPIAAIKWGLIGRGTAEISEISEPDSKVPAGKGSVIGASFDYPLSKRLTAGIALDWWMVETSHWPSLELTSVNLDGFELSAHLKGLISFHNGRYALRPGIGIGGCQGHYTMLAFHAGMEFQASVAERFGIGVEAGTWYSPAGTDDTVDIKVGPLGFLRFQLLIATGSRKPND